MNKAASRVLDHLGLREFDTDKFRGDTANEGWGQVFGGQLMAQALSAAGSTVSDDKDLVSFHADFRSRADTEQHLEYVVDRTRDGRAFASREVQALQAETSCFTASALYQLSRDGLEHSKPMPDVASPEECADIRQVVEAYDRFYPGHLPAGAAEAIPEQAIDTRFVDPATFLDPAAPGESMDQLVWIRFAGDIGPDLERHKLVLAYASDQSLAHVVAQPHGLGGMNPKLSFISLEHTMWFHRPCRVDEWLLLVRRCESSTGGRALVRGEIFTSDGKLVALLAQEALVTLV